MKISAVESNRQLLDGGSMFGNAPRAIWQRWIQPDDRDRIPLACRCFVVEWDGQKILLETGIGAFFEPKMADRFGVQTPHQHQLLENLQQLGYSEQDIDSVILSHLHFDHAGGLLPTYQETQKSGLRLLFPRAQYVVGKQAWERAMQPHSRDRASFLPELNKLLEKSGRLKLINSQSPQTLLNGKISFRFSNGHTPGQMHAVLHGNQQSAIFCGDLIPGSPWVHLPITMGYDRFPEMLIDEKQELYQTSVPDNWVHLFTHDPAISAATVELSEKGKYQTKQAFKELVQYEL